MLAQHQSPLPSGGSAKMTCVTATSVALNLGVWGGQNWARGGAKWGGGAGGSLHCKILTSISAALSDTEVFKSALAK